MCTYLQALWILLSLLIFAIAQDIWSPESNTQCDCFRTASNAIYQNHFLVDFRHGKPANFDPIFYTLETAQYARKLSYLPLPFSSRFVALESLH